MKEKIGRNDFCPCGSGKKYKKCCLEKLQPSADELAWRRIHSSHVQLTRKLMEFTAKTYGPAGYDEAWDEFNLWSNEEPFDPQSPLHPMFGPWMFHHWIPDFENTNLGDEIPTEVSPSQHFLDKFRRRLDALEIEDLEESLRRPYSFYDVVECNPGFWVKVQDLLTEDYFTVSEKMGSQAMKAGDLLFGKVVTVRDICMFDGLAPLAFPPQYTVKIIPLRKKFKKVHKSFTSEILREYDIELLEIFWDFYENLRNPQMPILSNTDGHLLVPHKLVFAIESTDEAFNALHDLNFNATKEELYSDAVLFEDGKIKSIEFPWLVRGNKKNKHWENTVLGHVRLESGKMIVEVNSKERSKNFLSVLKKRMPKGWTLLETVTEDLRSQLKNQIQSGAVFEEDEATKELNERPEVKAAMAKMNEGHWKNWPTTRLPALQGKTPIEAVRSKDGRAMVDALLTDFERRAERNPLPGQTTETFHKLRERLGV